MENPLITKIKEYIPNENIEFIYRDDGIIELRFYDRKALMSILPSNTWNEIKRHIDAKINKIDTDCTICCNLIKQRVTCTKCSNFTCINCYINMCKENNGLCICPFCKFTHGHKVNKHMLKLIIEHMLSKVKK